MSYKPPLWKQLLGAGIGALIAMALYGGYTALMPYLEEGVQGLQAHFLDDFLEQTTIPPRPSRRFIRELAYEQNEERLGITRRARELALQSISAQATEEQDAEPIMMDTTSASAQVEQIHEEIRQVEEVIDDGVMLPSSGITLWLVTFAALFGGAFLHRKRLQECVCPKADA